MGLDTIVSRTPDDVTLTDEDQAAFAVSGIELCGGMYSDGSTSIRGKVYDDVVREATGESLYCEWMPPETVAVIAEALAQRTPAELAVLNTRARGSRQDGGTNPDEMADLQRFFALCAERGLGLIGWM
jgi:hypothetical protein